MIISFGRRSWKRKNASNTKQLWWLEWTCQQYSFRYWIWFRWYRIVLVRNYNWSISKSNCIKAFHFILYISIGSRFRLNRLFYFYNKFIVICLFICSSWFFFSKVSKCIYIHILSIDDLINDKSISHQPDACSHR
jgi:hypothetical protein